MQIKYPDIHKNRKSDSNCNRCFGVEDHGAVNLL